MSTAVEVLARVLEGKSEVDLTVPFARGRVSTDLIRALKAAGYAVVKLPDLDGIAKQHIRFGPECEEAAEHGCAPWVQDDDTDISYSTDEAREVGAALIAAADAAEAGR